MVQRPPAGSIPDAPGSYQFKDARGRVIYVGKAKSLRSRLSNYFQNPANLPPRTSQMVQTAESVEWIQVRNDVEALMLENTLIKQHQPRFNVRLRDDKSYPFLAVTVGDEWPRAMVMRGRKRKGVRYFGPYGHAYAIRETLDLLLRTFPIRTCSDNKLGRHQRLGRPCLLFHIEKCSGPCVGEITPEEYERLVNELIEFLDGDTDAIVHKLERQMSESADALEFERAARLRDRLASVQRAIEKQQMVGDKGEDLDVIGLAGDDLEAAVQVFYVRKGRVVGRKGLDARQGRGPVAGRADRSGARRPVRRGAAARRAQAGAGAGAVGRSRVVRGVAVGLPRLARHGPGARSGATSGRCSKRSPRTRRRSSPATDSSARRITTAGPARCASCRRRSGCPRLRCASSATT